MNMDASIVSLAFIDSIGGPELLMIMFVALLLFGGEKLPSLARTLGKSLNELKKASGEVEREIKRAMEEEAPENSAAKKPGGELTQPASTVPSRSPELPEAKQPEPPPPEKPKP
jgi:sec-independent protein translocase protein TatA